MRLRDKFSSSNKFNTTSALIAIAHCRAGVILLTQLCCHGGVAVYYDVASVGCHASPSHHELPEVAIPHSGLDAHRNPPAPPRGTCSSPRRRGCPERRARRRRRPRSTRRTWSSRRGLPGTRGRPGPWPGTGQRSQQRTPKLLGWGPRWGLGPWWGQGPRRGGRGGGGGGGGGGCGGA